MAELTDEQKAAIESITNGPPPTTPDVDEVPTEETKSTPTVTPVSPTAYAKIVELVKAGRLRKR